MIQEKKLGDLSMFISRGKEAEIKKLKKVEATDKIKSWRKIRERV